MGKIKLQDAIKNSYSSSKKQKKNMSGYERDDSLSNDNQQVYYNKADNKLLYTVAGTHNLSDVGTDIMYGLGLHKKTKRYQEAHSKLREAKAKYGVNEATVVGHSLGGGIARGIATDEDKIVTYNKAAVPFEKQRGNETSYRTRGDWVSMFAKARTLDKKLNKNHTAVGRALEAHDSSNLQDSGIDV